MDFSDLYRRYAPDVFRFALYLSGNRELADEITAETFARALTARQMACVAAAALTGGSSFTV